MIYDRALTGAEVASIYAIQRGNTTLRIQPQTGGAILLSWDAAVTNALLETTSDLATNGWHTVTNNVVPSGSQNTITLPIAHWQRFFRLKIAD